MPPVDRPGRVKIDRARPSVGHPSFETRRVIQLALGPKQRFRYRHGDINLIGNTDRGSRVVVSEYSVNGEPPVHSLSGRRASPSRDAGRGEEHDAGPGTPPPPPHERLVRAVPVRGTNDRMVEHPPTRSRGDRERSCIDPEEEGDHAAEASCCEKESRRRAQGDSPRAKAEEARYVCAQGGALALSGGALLEGILEIGSALTGAY